MVDPEITTHKNQVNYGAPVSDGPVFERSFIAKNYDKGFNLLVQVYGGHDMFVNMTSAQQDDVQSAIKKFMTDLQIIALDPDYQI